MQNILIDHHLQALGLPKNLNHFCPDHKLIKKLMIKIIQFIKNLFVYLIQQNTVRHNKFMTIYCLELMLFVLSTNASAININLSLP